MSVLTYQHILDAQNKLSGITSVSGIRVIFSEYACDPEYELVKRSWKERFFTRPWEPRRKYKQVMTALNPLMYKMNTTGGEMIVAHPSYKEQLRHLTSGSTLTGAVAPGDDLREQMSLFNNNQGSHTRTSR